MSIQGSVNQLLTVGGSFAGMYGLLNPERKQGRELVKETKSGLGYVSEYLNKHDKIDISKMSKEQLNEFEDTLNITSEREKKIFEDVHNNPNLLKNKEINDAYEDIVKRRDKLDYNNIREQIANRREILNQPTVDDIVKEKKAQGWNISIGYPTDKAQAELQTEGIQKVNQRDAYNQRRKDKGDI